MSALKIDADFKSHDVRSLDEKCKLQLKIEQSFHLVEKSKSFDYRAILENCGFPVNRAYFRVGNETMSEQLVRDMLLYVHREDYPSFDLDVGIWSQPMINHELYKKQNCSPSYQD